MTIWQKLFRSRKASPDAAPAARPSADKVIILSAGQGKRLMPFTAERPKCLLPLCGRSVLEWQLDGLARAGVRDAVVVTGFAAQQVEAVLARVSFPGLTVRTLYNPFYTVADNLGSCWIARQEMTGDFMILNGDTLFEPAVAERVVRSSPTAAITVTVNKKPSYDADDMKVMIDGTKLTAIGKTLDVNAVDGESIGFLRFTPRGGELFRAQMDRLMAQPEGLKLWYLSVIDRIAKATGEVGVLSIQGFDWGELDFPADLEALQRMVEGWVARGAASSQPARTPSTH